MKRLLYILTLTLLTVLTVLTSCKTFSGGQDWSTIKEFKFYGFVNPTDNQNIDKFVLADNDTIKKLFANLRKSKGYLPKGASRYAKITFDNDSEIIIQIIAGGQLPFREINKDSFTDNWYELSEISGTEWTNYIDNLTIKLEK